MILAPLLLVAQVVTPPVPKGIAGGGTLNRVEIPLPPAKEKWIRVESPHFIFISSASERETRSLAADLEKRAVALQRLHPRFRELPLERSRVLFFARRADAQPYFDLLLARGTRSRGAFISGGEGTTMVLSAGRMPDRTPYHELVHNLMRGRTRPPLWLEEGLAEYYGRADFRASSEIPRTRRMKTFLVPPPALHFEPITSMLTAPRDTFQNASFYLQALASVDWLMRTNRVAFDAFETDVEHGIDVQAALRKHYNATLRDLEQGVAGFAHSTPYLLQPPQTEVTPAVAPLRHADVLFELGSFLGEFESTRADAERHFRAALDLDPHHARALAGLGMLRARAKELDAATPFFEQAIAAAPGDPFVLLAYAEALLGNAIGPFAGAVEVEESELARFRRARDLAQCALDHGSDEARARADIGVSWTIERDVRPAIEQLESAHKLAPGRYDIALNLYAMYLRSGQRAKADALYAAEFEHAHDTQIAFAAKSVLVRELTARANALVTDQKLDEAVAIIRELAAATPDAAARRELDVQAAQLARTAETNRHIIEYNTALEELKHGDRTAALKRIDALLAVATDPEVIADAKELRRELLRR